MAVYAVPTDRPFVTTKPLKRKNSPEVKARLKEGFELYEKVRAGKFYIDFENDLMVFTDDEDDEKHDKQQQ